MTVLFQDMHRTIKTAFVKAGMEEETADLAARIHTESSCDGVYSHGLNRVPRFVEYLQTGLVDPHGEPELVESLGNLEKYDGHLGPGILNARFAMNRAIEIAGKQGMGLVALRNTTHWMRGGSYGWQAAEAGFGGICWTNTESCMPAWGAKECCVGNNPFVMALPYEEGPVVLDMAMSQYSYGKLEVTRLAGETLPYPGGFDRDGNLTDDPGALEESKRLLPTGYWKGSGLATLLNLTAALLSGGLTTSGIDQAGKGSCGGCSQIFLAFSPEAAGGKSFMEETLKESMIRLHGAEPETPGGTISYPGERTLKTRRKNREEGIPVDEGVWKQVCLLAGV